MVKCLKISGHTGSRKPFPAFSRIALFLALVNINLGNLLYFGDPTARMTSCFLGMVLVASILRENWRFKKRALFQSYILAALSFAWMLLFLFSSGAGFIGLVCALECLMALGAREGDQGQIHACMATTGLVALFDYGYSHSTLVWYGVKGANHLLMNLIGALTRQEMLFGHHSSGFFILIPGILYVLVLIVQVSMAGKEKLTDILAASGFFLLLILASLTIYLFGQQVVFSRIRLNIYEASSLLTPFETHWLAFLIFLIPLYFISRRLLPVNLHPNRSSKSTRSIIGWLAAVFLLLCSLIMWDRWKICHFSPPDDKTILIYDNLDWSVPKFGYYGERSGGMFGSLPDLLSSLGYTVQVDRVITEEKLKKFNALVIINLMEGFDEPTRKAIHHYIKAGGSLLVMGDHTGFGFIREPLNDLLQPLPISFQFDSARPFISSWQDCMEIRPHRITEQVITENDVQIWTGASLAVYYPANPILIGKRAFSDAGDRTNSRDGFLGDLWYQKTEWLGDVVLAAEARFGQGKVLVFGDTSSLQNGSLLYNQQFIQDIFRWLTEESLPERSTCLRYILWLVFLFFLVLAWYEYPPIAVLWLVCSLYLFQAPARFFHQPGRCPRHKAKALVACIDNSHGEFFDVTGWQKNSLDGLAYNLMRNRYTPFITKRLDFNLLDKSDLGIFINPTQCFSRKEEKALRAFMEKGGLLIWTAGWTIKEASRSFWGDLGLSLANVPLGPVKGNYGNYEVQFQDAWPIRIEKRIRDRTRIFLQKGEYPLVVFRRYGQGGILVIPDTRFLLNRNLEHGNNCFQEGNIFFFRDVIKEISRG
ncbi:MAG: hypothetical protein AB1611_02910 [bacterium]